MVLLWVSSPDEEVMKVVYVLEEAESLFSTLKEVNPAVWV